MHQANGVYVYVYVYVYVNVSPLTYTLIRTYAIPMETDGLRNSWRK